MLHLIINLYLFSFTSFVLFQMNSFFEKYPDAGAGKANRAKALETVQNNIRWLSNYKSVVETWISKNVS